ncbi:unnamed protein product [Sphagnum jensenii]|uniref:Uncharacterized protein n=1 Tax=Sphagnum jensenii TaxID=128206 RepID=A0ABP1AXA9_9BRYO
MEEAKTFVVEYDDNDDSCSWGAAAAAAAECKAIKGKTLSCSNTALPRPAAAIHEDHTAAAVDHHHHHYDVDQLLQLLHGSDPVRMELARLENELKDKERELVEAQAEIKALKVADRMKEKAVEELAAELEKVDKKLKAMEILLDNKNLEVKRINDEKKAALAAQIAAEATVRRVQLAAAQKDEDQLLPWSIDAIVAPLESELKLARQEIAKLQENNRALERLTKSKEAALVEAGKTVEVAEAKAATIDDLQNQNQELLRKIEIYQEDNKCLDKMHRQKVAEVEKLSTTVDELQEAVAAGGTAAHVNAAIRDYQRQVQELSEGKKTLERELARAKISANRVATVVANSWKDSEDKLMPVKQWLDERRVMQGEIQKLREKLAAMEKSAKNELQLKDKLHLRLKVSEEALRVASNNSTPRNSSSEKGPQNAIFANNGFVVGHPSAASSVTLLKNQRALTSKSFDGGRSLDDAECSPSTTALKSKFFTSGSQGSSPLLSARKINSLVAKSSETGSVKKKGPGGINCRVATATDNKLKEPTAHPHAQQVANENVDSFNNQACPADDDDNAVEVLPKSKETNSQSKVKEVDSDDKKILWREAVAAPEEKLEVAAANIQVERDNKHIKLLSMSKPGRFTADNSSHPLPTRSLRSSKDERPTKNQTGSYHLQSSSSSRRSHISAPGPCHIVPVSVPGLITNFIPASY